MDKKLKKAKKYYEEHYYNQEIEDNIKEKVEQNMRVQKNPMSFGKKIIVTSSIIVLVISLLVGSTYVSPTMAEVVAKIPFISEFMKTREDQRERMELVNTSLGNKTDHTLFVSPNFKDKKAIVRVNESDKYIQTHKEEIVKMVEDELTNHNFNGYSVKVERVRPSPKPDISKEDQELVAEIDKVMAAIRKKLEHSDYHLSGFGIDADKEISMEVPYNKDTNKLRELIQAALDEGNYHDYTINIKRIDRDEMEKREQDQRWAKARIYIYEALKEKEHLDVTGFAYSNHPLPMTIIIKTSIHPWSFQKDEKVGEIEKLVEEFLSSKQAEPYVKDDPYKLVIRDKNHDDIFTEEKVAE
ncbi:DUF4030 domain-containing protein [Salinibacillus xinjiangensis]|uniref:DUF4030 domain-containing protein n=1 Tax=Salinibacillus xinjiangensis TaxID=1229268 RepID=A0A6G1XBN3_9BACI|nr:DUF4030 domain-containing protein [Salinibacillus xinjiangensis]MRG88342.1 DUF4030 domain-containing protein [Salinibacillus xinjiangensis]